ncbi:MAG TPA: DUF302 domain-containing protein [Candidatus Limnocylindrales bacterium]|nr:DUF302 domain-containing protein [Candidatus Limnocylindrales bacterium]
MSSYTFAAAVPEPIEQVRASVETALKDEGFGVLTEIDVAATLRTKLGLDRAPYLILGACNPVLAHRALEVDPSIGRLLPGNVVLRESDDSGTIVEILDPSAALGIAGSPGIAPIATEAADRLQRVLDAVTASSAMPGSHSSAPTHRALS